MTLVQICLHTLLATALAVTPTCGLSSPPDISPPTTVIPAELFGMHFHHLGGTTPWPDAPIAEWRLWDAYVAWPNLQPAKNRWRFELLDHYVAMAAEHHVGLLLPLGLSPAWASARPLEKSTYSPGFAAEPRDMEDWRTYVRTVVQRYKGRIGAYEIWNEPNLKQFWSGSVDQMIGLTAEAARIIRSIDPQALIVSPSATQDRGLAWLSEFLSKGGGTVVDVIGYHLYVAPQPPESTLALASSVKQLMLQAGIADKPLWNTEAGWFLPKPFPPELAAAYVIREFVVNWAAGVQRLYWYAWDNHGWVSLETTQRDNTTLTVAGDAYAVAFRWLIGSRMQSCSEDNEQTWTCEIERDRHRQWMVWNVTGARLFHVPGEWHAQSIELVSGSREPLRNDALEIGQTPVLVSSAGS
jgi:hypothetical protein